LAQKVFWKPSEGLKWPQSDNSEKVGPEMLWNYPIERSLNEKASFVYFLPFFDFKKEGGIRFLFCFDIQKKSRIFLLYLVPDCHLAPSIGQLVFLWYRVQLPHLKSEPIHRENALDCPPIHF